MDKYSFVDLIKYLQCFAEYYPILQVFTSRLLEGLFIIVKTLLGLSLLQEGIFYDF